MTKSDLITRVARANPALTRQDVERAVNQMFEEITAQLEQDGRAEFRGFGTFEVRRQRARRVRVPRTREYVDVVERHRPWFRPGEPLRKRLNDDT